MIKLCGFPLSNYHNKAKMALLEKGIPFEEHLVHPRTDRDEMLLSSPLAKVPYLITGEGALSESNVIVEYLEKLKPGHYSDNAFKAAKEREIVTYLELHLELVIREFYGSAFFGMDMPSDSAKSRVEKLLIKNILAMKPLFKFAPYIAGDTFTNADMAAFVHFPLASMAMKAVFGKDLLVEHGIDWKPYVKMLGERSSAQRINEDRKAYAEAKK
jgi:glutathione S-transferase